MAFQPRNNSFRKPQTSAAANPTLPKVGRLTLKGVRLSFPKLFTPSQVSDASKPTYSATFLIPKDTPEGKAQAQAVNAAMSAVAKQIWGDQIPKLKPEKLALRDGDQETWDGYEGCWYVNARNPKRVPVVDRDGQTPLVESDGKIYGGCYVNAVVTIWAQNNSYGQRINATLEAVQFVREGEPFGSGAPRGESFFTDLTAEETTGGLHAADLNDSGFDDNQEEDLI